MMAAISPYWGKEFFGFFLLLGQRFWQGITGHLSLSDLAADEIQILVISLIALAAGLLAPFLVLRRMTMIANSLSHTTLVGILVAYALVGQLDLVALCVGALIAALLTVALMELLQTIFRLPEDATMGLVFTSLFALGILGVSLFFRDLHLGTETVMGNVDALRLDDVWIALGLLLFNLVGIAISYHPLKVTCFDAALARSLGIATGRIHFLLMFLVAATTVGAMRAVGVLLILAFLVVPYLIARLFCDRLFGLLIATPLIGLLASWVGVAISRHLLTLWDLPLSTGGIVVLTLVAFYFLAFGLLRIYTPFMLKLKSR